MAESFARPEDLNTFTGRSIPEPQAVMMLAQASAVIRSFCRWHLYPSTQEALIVDGSGGVVQPLPTLRLSEVSVVREDGVELEPDEYEWSASGFLRKVGGCWTNGLRAVEATVTHGYEEAPLEVVAVCLQVAARVVASPSGVKAEQSGGLSVTYSVPGGLSGQEADVLERHRIPAEV